MSNHSPKHSQPSNFWFGFALGTVSVSALAYLLGTKKGRDQLKKVLEYAEQYEYNSDDFYKLIDALRALNTLEARGEGSHRSHSQPTASSSSITDIMSKMKDVTEEKKQPKKFITKD